uniref:Uncharacterized protein n=1 Tax=Anguilla anguilla TaxID=7936 RepID=A0A0E9TVW8_ANGAN
MLMFMVVSVHALRVKVARSALGGCEDRALLGAR